MIKRVGYGLSSCLVAITQDGIPLDTVLYIVSSTAYRSRTEMVEKLALTLRGADAPEMLANATALWDTGRIFQPSVRPAGRRPSTALWRTATAEEVAMDADDGAPHDDFRHGPGPGKSLALAIANGDIPSYVSRIPGVGGFFGQPGIGKTAVIDVRLAAMPLDDTAPASKLAVRVAVAAMGKDMTDGEASVALTTSQTHALQTMLSGRSSVVCGVPRSGRSMVAAFAASRWDRVARGYGAENALILTVSASDADMMRRRSGVAVMTYEEFEMMQETDEDVLLNYGFVILDDYTVRAAMRIDPLLYALPTLPVVRIVREEEKLSLRADVGLLTAIRQA